MQNSKIKIANDRLTIDEGAEELRMSPGWLRMHIRAGKISAVRLGRIYFLKRSTVENLKQNGLSL